MSGKPPPSSSTGDWKLRAWQAGVLAAVFGLWYALTKPGLLPLFVFDNDTQAAFFFGEPLVIVE